MKWISVKDSLPNEGQFVFVTGIATFPTYERRWYWTMQLKGGRWTDGGDNENDLADVTHWMKPEPPPQEDALSVEDLIDPNKIKTEYTVYGDAIVTYKSSGEVSTEGSVVLEDDDDDGEQ